MNSSTATLGILISGRGSNMKAIVSACREGGIPGRVAIIISNREDAPGIRWAAENDLETAILPHRAFNSREEHDRAIVRRLREAGVDWVCLAGYMRLLSEYFVQAFEARILNIHPSLLPAFPGLHAQQQALDHGVRITGCTVHLVDTELDHGPIIEQTAVPVFDGDDDASLSARLILEEHRCYRRALRKVLTTPWRQDGRRLIFDENLN